jgi:poly-beta-1,6-N-acetyl-D-glucosamine synthase
MTASRRYVLVTPARNEAGYIGQTIQSVMNQTLLPVEWVIVSDGSIDKTDEIVTNAAQACPWLRLLRLSPRATRSFDAVVHAAEAGYDALSSLDYEYIGLLDADIGLPADYFERVIRYFEATPGLGLAGGMAVDVGQRKDVYPRNRQDVPGAVQVFRRACFTALGGLIAVPEGGWDGLACARVRMLGFETRLLTDLVVDHLKPRNSAEGGSLRRRWQMGVRDYAVGYHPLFELCKCLGRAHETPWVIGALAWWVGYCGAALQRRSRIVPRNIQDYIRKEQLERLWLKPRSDASGQLTGEGPSADGISS